MTAREAPERLEGVKVMSVHVRLDGFAAFTGRSGRGALIKVVGRGDGIQPRIGDVYDVTGVWLDHPRHGRQLHVDAASLVPRPPSGRLVAAWLRRIPGIGEDRAERLLERYGAELDEVLSNRERLAELAEALEPTKPHLAMRIAAEAYSAWEELRSGYAAARFLDRHGVDRRAGRRIIPLLGAEAERILAANPYVLVGVLPWKDADAAALRILGDTPESRASAKRIVGAIDAVMKDAVSRGDTALAKANLAGRVEAKLGRPVDPERLQDLGFRNAALVDGGDVWRSPGCAFMEDELAERFGRMLRGEERSKVRPRPEADLRRIVAYAAAETGPLADEQLAAAVRVLSSAVACLTGGAGTGKTTTCRAIVKAWELLGGRVELAALSGKAALRLAEGTGRLGSEHRPSLTIHRLLLGLRKRSEGDVCWGPPPQEGQPVPPERALPKLTDRTLLVIDEASMVDLGQMHAVVEAMPAGCRLLLVGDAVQLPPVGFGLVFHRLVEDPAITARLDIVRRQADASGIPLVSGKIREGQVPDLPEWRPGVSGVAMLAVRTGDVTRGALRVVSTIGRARPGEVMVISPVNRRSHRPDGTVDALNAALQRLRGDPGRARFLSGDPVCFTRNDYGKGLRNGSLGQVIEAAADKLACDFDGVRHEFGPADMADVVLAYALTCHRAQGSQARTVIVSLIDAPNVDPSWLYTAITRGAERVVLVGEPDVLARAMSREAAFRRRTVGMIGRPWQAGNQPCSLPDG